VIETARKRRLSPWSYLATLIAERRKGSEAPPIPAIVSMITQIDGGVITLFDVSVSRSL
jgi:hypothetical protein